jgi:hypothetical protein
MQPKWPFASTVPVGPRPREAGSPIVFSLEATRVLRALATRDPSFLRRVEDDPRAALASLGALAGGELSGFSWQDPGCIEAAVRRAARDPRGWRLRVPLAARGEVVPSPRDITYGGAVAKPRPEGPRVLQRGGPRLDLVLGHPPPDAKPQEALGGPLRAVKLWQITGGVRVVDAGPNGRFSSEDVDVDRHYGIPTRSRTVATANIAKTDLGIPIQVGDKLIFFFGDTWAYDVFRNPGPIIGGDPYGWTEARQDVFSEAPWIRFFTDSEPRGWAIGTGFAPLLRGVLPDEAIGGTKGPLGAFYDPRTDTAYVFFVADTTESPRSVHLNRTVVAAARNVSRSFVAVPPRERDVSMDVRYSTVEYPDGVERIGETWAPPAWEIVSLSTGLLRAISPVLVDRAAVEPRATEAERAGGMGVERSREILYPGTSRRDIQFAPPVRSARLGSEPGPVVLMFGTDARYRGSYVYLARCLLSDLDRGPRPVLDAFAQDLSALPSGRKLQYLQWVDYSKTDDGEPFWTENPEDPAQLMPLFTSTGPTVGQPHVVQEPKTGLWLMTHEGPNSPDPGVRGLRLRWAKNPWGPWGRTTMVNPHTGLGERFEPAGGEPELILFGDRDQPYGNYMHAVRLPRLDGSVLVRIPVPRTLTIRSANPSNGGLFGYDGDDGLSDSLLRGGGDATAQGAYGAYMVVPWFRYRRSPSGSLLIDIVYTLATGDPFQVQLMSTAIEVHEGLAGRLDAGIEQRPRRGI